MMMGKGFHGGFHGRGKGGDNLPFAGIPPEMVDKTNAVMEEEPDFSDLSLEFSHRPDDAGKFSLLSFLEPYKYRMLGALGLVGVTEALLLMGPYLIRLQSMTQLSLKTLLCCYGSPLHGLPR